MRIKEVKMYQFEELPKERQSKILDDYRNINVESDDWYEYIISDFCHDIEAKGFLVTPKDVEFDLHGQGSGACFKGRVDGMKFIDAIDPDGSKYPRLRNKYKEGSYDLNIIRTSTHYSHSYTMEISAEDHDGDEEENTDDVNKLVDNALEGGSYTDKLAELSVIVLEEARALADGLYKQLNDAYMDAISDEQVIATIMANEIEFTE